jgi:acyl-CoA synthetase (AMP-forming)/AMP-acid ligase II
MTVIREWIDAAAAREPDATYLEEARGTDQLSYASLQRSARTWALHLDRAGIPPGARVAIRLPEPVGYAGALVAILGAGRVVVPLDPAAPPAALAGMLEVARPVAVVAQSSSGLPPGLPVLRPPKPGEADKPHAAHEANEPHALHEPDETGRALPAGGIFLCTSGTTGAPKGVLLREEQLGHVAACVAMHHRLTPADRGYCCLPLFHINAEVVGLLATLAARACLVLDRAFSRRGFWAMIEQQQVTWINAVPAIITILAMEPPAVPPPGRVRFVRSASAPLPPSALRRFEEAFGIPVLETYGMTEAASMITANPLDGPRKPGSAGRPAAAEVRIAELAGEGYEPCPPGAVGRVQIRGPGVITGYAAGGTGVDGLAGAVGADGWLDTGDLGHLDSDGYLFLAGRSDDVINRGGEKIYPREIEDFLLAQPGVRSAAVVAARDEVLGERPVAYVVPAGEAAQLEETQLEGAQLEDAAQLEDTLRTACEAALPRPKRPTAFHLVRELPLGPTGKVTRGRLRELAATG